MSIIAMLIDQVLSRGIKIELSNLLRESHSPY